ncbi:porin family protein [Bacteroides heparinolyticus]|uniref:porin family protein n=1 Tax=Prevotella heparinolytica TaxID=28113 RepID=UPI0035A13CA6
MNLKKLLLFACALFTFAMANAQGVSFSIKAAPVVSNYIGKQAEDQEAKARFGFLAGVGLDYGFYNGAAIQTGLYGVLKGARLTLNKQNPFYLQMPLHLAYKVDFTPGTRIVFHGGPYAAYAIAGTLTSEGENTDLFDTGSSFKRFDAGAGIGVGAEIDRFLLDLGWDMGFIDVSSSKMKNMSAYLTLGYRF